jgi:hypothetical protein
MFQPVTGHLAVTGHPAVLVSLGEVASCGGSTSETLPLWSGREKGEDEIGVPQPLQGHAPPKT